MSLIVLQATPFCNLNCTYCYLGDRSARAFMSLETVRRIAQAAFRMKHGGPRHKFLWHHGEPTAIGREFYREATLILEECAQGRGFTQVIQTNGLSLDDAWCDTLRSCAISVGLSIDGPSWLHDRTRIDRRNQGTHARVLRGIQLLQRKGIDFGAICVLTDTSLSHPDELFDFFDTNGFDWVGFNSEQNEGLHTRSSLAQGNRSTTEVRYQTFMRRLTVRWLRSSRRLRIREIDRVLLMADSLRIDKHFQVKPEETQDLGVISFDVKGVAYGFSPELVSVASSRAQFFLGNGDSLSNLDDLLSVPRYRDLKTSIDTGVERCRHECPFFSACGGGTPAAKYFEHGTFDATETVTCRLEIKSTFSGVLSALNEN